MHTELLILKTGTALVSRDRKISGQDAFPQGSRPAAVDDVGQQSAVADRSPVTDRTMAAVRVKPTGAASGVRPVTADPGATDPDAGLIGRMARGEASAVTQMVDKYLNRILNNAYHILRNREDAEEVAQEVFLKIWQQAKYWQFGRAKFSTWLYRVTINLCLDRTRKHRELAMADPPDMRDERPLASDAMEGREREQLVHAALSTLPDRQRAALALCYFDDLSNLDAADIMEVSVDALESLLARGRRNLRNKLAGHGEYFSDK